MTSIRAERPLRSFVVLALVLVAVVVGRPGTAVGADSTSPIGTYETATPTTAGVAVSGWALDPDGVDHQVAVAVFDNGALVAYVPLATGDRPDVGDAYPGFGSAHGFSLTFSAAAGMHEVCVVAYNEAGSGGTDSSLGCRSVTLGTPFGVVDDVRWQDDGFLHAVGWAIDSDTTAAVAVAGFANGELVAYSAAANVSRPDVGAAFPGYGDNHGFDLAFPFERAAAICVAAYNAPDTPGADQGIDCHQVGGTRPIGNYEQLVLTPSGFRASGWALDESFPSASVSIAVFDNGELVNFGGAAANRPDVGAAYPNAGPDHGFDALFGWTYYGPHQICVVAYGHFATEGNYTGLGCRTFVLSPTLGNLESVTRSSATVHLSGWVLDVRNGIPGTYSVRVDDVLVTTGTANLDRPDVGAAFPGYGDNHGLVADVEVAPGLHEVCVFATDSVMSPSRTVALGCVDI